MSYTIRHFETHGSATQRRYGQVLGWCYAMRWVYEVQSWSKDSKKILESVIKKLEKSPPGVFDKAVEIKNVGAQQRKFLEWACEHLGITPQQAEEDGSVPRRARSGSRRARRTQN